MVFIFSLLHQDKCSVFFHFTAEKVVNVKALNKLSAEPSLYGDSTYTDYDFWEAFLDKGGVFIKSTMREKHQNT